MTQPPATDTALADRTELRAGLLGVAEELERVGLLVPLHEAVQGGPAQLGQRAAGRVAGQGGPAQLGQRAAGRVAEQARLDDLERERVVALRDERGGGVGEPFLAAA